MAKRKFVINIETGDCPIAEVKRYLREALRNHWHRLNLPGIKNKRESVEWKLRALDVKKPFTIKQLKED